MRPTVMSEPIVTEIYVRAYIIPPGGVATHPLADRAAVQGDRQVSVHERGARRVDRDRHAARGVSGGDEALERGRRRLAGDERNPQPQPGGHRPASPAALREPVVSENSSHAQATRWYYRNSPPNRSRQRTWVPPRGRGPGAIKSLSSP